MRLVGCICAACGQSMIFHSKQRRPRTNQLRCPSCTEPHATDRSAGTLSPIERVSVALELVLIASQLEHATEPSASDELDVESEWTDAIERLKKVVRWLAPPNKP